MVQNREIDRLKWRLRREAGPVAALSNRATSTLLARGGAVADWVRAIGEERPLLTLLIALQIGFAVGRWRPRRAQH